MKKYLKLFLDELPRQTMFESLQVVLDHNEPDNEELIWVREFQEKYPGRLKHIIVNPVEAIGPSMNRCIKEADGEYVAIWNIDDLRTEDSLEQQFKVLEKNPDIGVVYGDYYIVGSSGSKDGKLVSHSKIPESEATRSMFWGPYVMFRKSLCNVAGYFDEQLKSGADFDLCVRLAFHTRAMMASGTLGYYLVEGLGASNRPGNLQALEATVICLRYGIYDKINYQYLDKVVNYDIDKIVQFGRQELVLNFVDNYYDLLANRKRQLLYRGIYRFLLRSIFGYKDNIKKILGK